MKDERAPKRFRVSLDNETNVMDKNHLETFVPSMKNASAAKAFHNKENFGPKVPLIISGSIGTCIVAQPDNLILRHENTKVAEDEDNESQISSDGDDSSENLTLAAFIALKSKPIAEPECFVSDSGPRMEAAKIFDLDNTEPLQLPHRDFIAANGPVERNNKQSFSNADHHKFKEPPSKLADESVCFICGCSFDRVSTGFKGRLNHLKRCSKNNGVTAQLMKIDDDIEEFQAPPVRCATIPNNPYTKINDEWHAGAQPAQEQVGKQTVISSFFKAPIKSINNVLMASARRIAKSREILSVVAKQKQMQQKASGRTSWGAPARRNGSCPFFKKIPGTDFVCDGFTYARSSLTKSYFLTHFHSDHYGGIDKSWNSGIIYCSLPTANLVSQQLGVNKKYLHPLEMNTPVVIESQGKPITITLFDANHCPGAVMFLFQVGRRWILHVGDFRWNRDRMYPDLKDFITLKIQLDDLFLDTTYCDEKYALPTQDDAIAAAVAKAEEEVKSSQRAGKRLLMLFGAYTIGKERIYLAVAEKLGVKIYVDTRRYRILEALNWPPDKLRLLTTKKEQSNLWVVPLGHINFKKLICYADGSNKAIGKQSFDKIVGFRPTGWTMTGRKDSGILNSKTNGMFTVHGVPYSEHSSFPELVECIECLKPKRIIPTVSVSKSDEQVALLLKELNKRK